MQPLLNLNTANIRPPVMVIFALLVLHSAALVGSMPERPENITVMFLSPTSVKITWSTASDDVEQYDVEYRPKLDRSYPFLSIVTCTRGSVTLDKLRPSTGYELTVTSVGKGRRTRSKTVTFRTLDENPRSERHQSNEKFQVRGVEVGIVILVLLVWIAAIVLFFNRWGKIRMLLPYQPDYKEQLKVTSTCGPNHQAGQACPQHMQWASKMGSSRYDFSASPGHTEGSSRPRINSVFIGPSSRLSPDFHVCRKVRSAEDIPLQPMGVFARPEVIAITEHQDLEEIQQV